MKLFSKEKQGETQKNSSVAKKSSVSKKGVQKTGVVFSDSSVPKHLFGVVLGPVVTEKARLLATFGVYTFLVSTTATKFSVTKAVEHMFPVNVTDVRIIRIATRKRRTRTGVGLDRGYKKALVVLRDGQNITY